MGIYLLKLIEFTLKVEIQDVPSLEWNEEKGEIRG